MWCLNDCFSTAGAILVLIKVLIFSLCLHGKSPFGSDDLAEAPFNFCHLDKGQLAGLRVGFNALDRTSIRINAAGIFTISKLGDVTKNK